MYALPLTWKASLNDISVRDELMSLLTALFNFTQKQPFDTISESAYCLIREVPHYEILFEIASKENDARDQFLENSRYIALQILSSILYINATG